MAFDIGNLGDGNGKVYIRLKTGAINTLPNEPNQVMGIMLDAVKSRLVYSKYTESTGGSFTDQFQDDDWGSRYYLNAEVAAPVGDLTGALDITKYVIDAQKCYKDNLTINAGEVTIVRYSFFHLILLTPETGTSDVLNYLNHDLQPGDLVFFTLSDDTNDTVIIQDSNVDDGNFKLQNGQDIVLQGPGSCAMFIRDASTAQLAGGKGFLREIGRPDQQAMGIANKNLTAGGGSYYINDISTADASRIDTKNGLVILHGNDVTLAAGWNVFGEMVNSARSQGSAFEIILDSALYTDNATGKTLTIFGIEIPDIYCLNYNFVVKAWFDDSDADPLNWEWKSRMYVDELLENWRNVVTTAGSGEDEALFTINPAIVSEASTAQAIRTLSHNSNVEARVQFKGYLVYAGSTTSTPGVLVAAGTFGIWGWMPDSNQVYVGAFCPVYDITDLTVVKTICYVGIYYGSTLQITVISGNTISTGDYIDVSPITYLAELQ